VKLQNRHDHARLLVSFNDSKCQLKRQIMGSAN
jgi:hypothetical protein